MYVVRSDQPTWAGQPALPLSVGLTFEAPSGSYPKLPMAYDPAFVLIQPGVLAEQAEQAAVVLQAAQAKQAKQEAEQAKQAVLGVESAAGVEVELTEVVVAEAEAEEEEPELVEAEAPAPPALILIEFGIDGHQVPIEQPTAYSLQLHVLLARGNPTDRGLAHSRTVLFAARDSGRRCTLATAWPCTAGSRPGWTTRT